MPEAISEKDIISMFRNENTKHKAFEMVLNLYQNKTYWHVRRIVICHDDANDVTQNAFIKVWENLHKFREDAKLFTWIFRIASNEALLFIQKKKDNLKISIDDLQMSLSQNLVSDPYFNGDAIALKLQHAVLSLPEKQRLVFNMKYFDNMKYEEIEAVLGTSVGGLKASYHHAVKKIEQFMKAD